MKLQESSRRKQRVVAVKSSLALSKLFHAGVYIQARTELYKYDTVRRRHCTGCNMYWQEAQKSGLILKRGRIMEIIERSKYNKFKLRFR